jgi:hypothetical protein
MIETLSRFLAAVAAADWGTAAEVKMVVALLLLSEELDELRGETPAPIGQSDWTRLVGLSPAQTRRAKHALCEAGVMTLVEEAHPPSRTPQKWRLQLDPRRWGRFAPREDHPWLPPSSADPPSPAIPYQNHTIVSVQTDPRGRR